MANQERISELIDNTEFSELCLSYQQYLHSLDDENYFEWGNVAGRHKHLKIGDMHMDEEHIFHCIYLAWLFIKKYPDYQLGGENDLNIDPIVPSTPVVLTGSRILNIKSGPSFKVSANQEIINKLGKSGRYPKICGYHDTRLKISTNHIEPKPDYWISSKFEVYLSENMNYHLLIHLSDNDDGTSPPKERLIIIMNVELLDLLKEIEKLRKWHGLPIDNHYALKQQIAKAGGHVPGARVLL